MQKIIQIKRPREIFASAWDKISKRTGTPEIEIGFLPNLSEKLWGLHRGEMMTIGARTSQGKSSFALQLAYEVAKNGHKVYFFSLEMSAEALMERMFCQIGMINNYELLYNPKEYAKQAENFKETVNDLPLVVTYNIGSTIDQLYQVIEDLPKPDVIILDYIQAIRKLNSDKLSEVNNYIVRFRELCVEKNFCGIMVSQINRGAMDSQDKKPQLWQLKNSGFLEEHSDTVLLLHWDYFYNNNNERFNEFDIIVAKQRNGATGTVYADFIPQQYRFKAAGPREPKKDYNTQQPQKRAREWM